VGGTLLVVTLRAVWLLLAFRLPGGTGWWALGLVVAAGTLLISAAVRDWPAGRVGTGAGLLFGAAALVQGRRLWDPPVPEALGDRLLGSGLPPGESYAAFLLSALAVPLAALAAVAGWPRVRAGEWRRILAAVLAGVLMGGLAGAAAAQWGDRLAGSTAEGIAAEGVDRTTTAGATPRSLAVPAPADLRGPGIGAARLWSVPSVTGTLVPGSGLAVACAVNPGDPDRYEPRLDVRVLDASSGRERWHWRALGALGCDVAVDVVHARLIVVLDRVAMVFELDTGRILDRIPLPRAGARWRMASTTPETSQRTRTTALAGPHLVLTKRRDGGSVVLAVLDLTDRSVREVDLGEEDCAYTWLPDPAPVPRNVVVTRSGCGPIRVLTVAGTSVARSVEVPLAPEVSDPHAASALGRQRRLEGADLGAHGQVLLVVRDGGSDPASRADQVIGVQSGEGGGLRWRQTYPGLSLGEAFQLPAQGSAVDRAVIQLTGEFQPGRRGGERVEVRDVATGALLGGGAGLPGGAFHLGLTRSATAGGDAVIYRSEAPAQGGRGSRIVMLDPVTLRRLDPAAPFDGTDHGDPLAAADGRLMVRTADPAGGGLLLAVVG
jgi:hypothetical protein